MSFPNIKSSINIRVVVVDYKEFPGFFGLINSFFFSKPSLPLQKGFCLPDFYQEIYTDTTNILYKPFCIKSENIYNTLTEEINMETLKQEIEKEYQYLALTYCHKNWQPKYTENMLFFEELIKNNFDIISIHSITVPLKEICYGEELIIADLILHEEL